MASLEHPPKLGFPKPPMNPPMFTPRNGENHREQGKGAVSRGNDPINNLEGTEISIVPVEIKFPSHHRLSFDHVMTIGVIKHVMVSVLKRGGMSSYDRL